MAYWNLVDIYINNWNIMGIQWGNMGNTGNSRRNIHTILGTLFYLFGWLSTLQLNIIKPVYTGW
jgi:hypothetical protein